jgi:hypothetical protein
MIKKIIRFHVFLGILILSVSAREKLYVFYPSVLDHHSIQDSMTHAMKGITITVFGRYDDFIEKVRSQPPNGIITKKVLIQKQLADYGIKLCGEKVGKDEVSYLILSTGKPFDMKTVSNKTVIGVTDILGRKDMKSFSLQFFPVEPNLKRVPKVVDLLSMLSFGAVSGVMIQDVFLDYFKSTSQLKFHTTPLPAVKNGIVVFAENKNKKAEKIYSKLKTNNNVICGLFYIDKWK